MLIPAPMKQFSCALAEKYPLIPAPMKQFEHAFTEKYSLIPAPEEQFIFLAAIVCAFQYPNKYSFISQKIRTFYIFPELLLTFYSIYDILNISIKKFLGRHIPSPSITKQRNGRICPTGFDASFFVFTGLYRLLAAKRGTNIRIMPDYNGNLLVHSMLPRQDGGVLAPPFCFSCKSFSLAARSSKRVVQLPADEKICNRTPCCCPEPSPIRFRVST